MRKIKVRPFFRRFAAAAVVFLLAFVVALLIYGVSALLRFFMPTTIVFVVLGLLILAYIFFTVTTDKHQQRFEWDQRLYAQLAKAESYLLCTKTREGEYYISYKVDDDDELEELRNIREE